MGDGCGRGFHCQEGKAAAVWRAERSVGRRWPAAALWHGRRKGKPMRLCRALEGWPRVRRRNANLGGGRHGSNGKRRRSAAAANSPGSNSPRSASVVSMVSGRRRRNMALNKMLASRGRRESISAKGTEGRHSPRRGRSNNLKHICNGDEVNSESKGSLMRR